RSGRTASRTTQRPGARLSSRAPSSAMKRWRPKLARTRRSKSGSTARNGFMAALSPRSPPEGTATARDAQSGGDVAAGRRRLKRTGASGRSVRGRVRGGAVRARRRRPAPRGSGEPAETEELDREELVEAVLRALAPDAGLLDPAEGRELAREDAGVDRDHADLERLRHPPDAPDVAGVEI